MKKESGLSNVVGVVLLLSLVIVTASILGFVLSSATYNAVDSTPNVIFTTSEDPSMLYNGGGDILYKDKLEFYAGGYNVNSYISLVDSDWTYGWHTGQAIKISYNGYSVSDLAIVALDSRGNGYLVYDGPTADPIPSGNPVPDVTPVPTPAPTPTPTPVRPDASFTLTSVDPGLNVSLGVLPPSLANSSDYFVVMERIQNWWSWWYTYEADVKFTANADGMLYAWSVSSGADIEDDTSRSPTVTFDESGLYNVTLMVTNTTSGLSNSSTQTVSVRNPGLTVMTWVTTTQNNNVNVFAYHGSNIYYPQWKLEVVNAERNNKGYRMTINLDYNLYTVDTYAGYPVKNTWYHVTGTYDEWDSELNLFVKHDRTSQQNSVTRSGSLIDFGGGTTWGEINHFTCDSDYSYEIPFSLTAAEIQIVYDAEDMDGHIS